MRDVKQLHPELQDKIKLLKAKFPTIGFSECLRTVKEQDDLYAKGRTAPGKKVTNAKGSTYSSQHQWGIAVDFYNNEKGNLYPEPFMTNVGRYAQSIGLGWGGAWKSLVDKPHLYLPQWGDTTKQLKAKYGTPDKFMTTWAKPTDSFDCSLIFHKDFYKAMYPDVKSEWYDHFVTVGIKERRMPSPCFDFDFYNNLYPDLQKALKNDPVALCKHYIECGIQEGRQGSIAFNVDWYKNNYADVKKVFGETKAGYVQHFLDFGMKEGRKASKDFDIKVYLSKNTDLLSAFGKDYFNGYVHYFKYGRKEKRILV